MLTFKKAAAQLGCGFLLAGSSKKALHDCFSFNGIFLYLFWVFIKWTSLIQNLSGYYRKIILELNFEQFHFHCIYKVKTNKYSFQPFGSRIKWLFGVFSKFRYLCRFGSY